MRLPGLLVVSLTLLCMGASGAPARLLHDTDPVPAPSAATQAATPSPDEIYSRAVREMRALATTGNPPFLVFDLRMDSHNLHWQHTTGDDGSSNWDVKLVHANETTNYRVWYRAKDQRSLMQDQATHAAFVGDCPFVPETTFWSDIAGVKAQPSPSPSPASGDAASASGHVIGNITVNGSSHYSISLVGIEQHEGHPVYHLHLHAYRDIEDYPLTDLWVDTNDYRVWAAHGEMTFRAVAAAMGVGISVDFAPTDRYWLVSDLDVTLKGYVMLWHASTETIMHATVLTAPNTLPASYFELKKPS